jgi:hypothetical protein
MLSNQLTLSALVYRANSSGARDLCVGRAKQLPAVEQDDEAVVSRRHSERMPGTACHGAIDAGYHLPFSANHAECARSVNRGCQVQLHVRVKENRRHIAFRFMALHLHGTFR